jgi:hypothetical protein
MFYCIISCYIWQIYDTAIYKCLLWKLRVYYTQIEKRSLALIVYFITSFWVSDHSLRRANDKLLKDVMWSLKPYISIELHVMLN